MIEINGYTCEQRIVDAIQEIQAGHDVDDIISHHLGVCYNELQRMKAIVDAQKVLIMEYELITDRGAYADDEYDSDDDFYAIAKAERAVKAAEEGRKQ